jgi:hypothetical protein
MMRGSWGRRWGSPWGVHSRRRSHLPLVLAVLVIWIAWRLLAGMWTVFQHAFLYSYYFVPGRQVASAYWGSVRFAFGATILVTALAAAVGALVLLQVVRWRDWR